MLNVKSHKVLFFFLLHVVAVFVIPTIAQSALAKKESEYQNQRRSIGLGLMRFEIKNLEDAPMRCFARTQIVRFIFQKGVTSHFDMANEFALDCLEDIQKNADQFSEQQIGYWKSNLIVLLRVNSPEVAAKAEAKYFSGEKTDWSDMLEIDASHDLGGVTNRIIDRIRRGDLRTTSFLFSRSSANATRRYPYVCSMPCCTI